MLSSVIGFRLTCYVFAFNVHHTSTDLHGRKHPLKELVLTTPLLYQDELRNKHEVPWHGGPCSKATA